MPAVGGAQAQGQRAVLAQAVEAQVQAVHIALQAASGIQPGARVATQHAEAPLAVEGPVGAEHRPPGIAVQVGAAGLAVQAAMAAQALHPQAALGGGVVEVACRLRHAEGRQLRSVFQRAGAEQPAGAAGPDTLQCAEHGAGDLAGTGQAAAGEAGVAGGGQLVEGLPGAGAVLHHQGVVQLRAALGTDAARDRGGVAVAGDAGEGHVVAGQLQLHAVGAVAQARGEKGEGAGDAGEAAADTAGRLDHLVAAGVRVGAGAGTDIQAGAVEADPAVGLQRAVAAVGRDGEGQGGTGREVEVIHMAAAGVGGARGDAQGAADAPEVDQLGAGQHLAAFAEVVGVEGPAAGADLQPFEAGAVAEAAAADVVQGQHVAAGAAVHPADEAAAAAQGEAVGAAAQVQGHAAGAADQAAVDHAVGLLADDAHGIAAQAEDLPEVLQVGGIGGAAGGAVVDEDGVGRPADGGAGVVEDRPAAHGDAFAGVRRAVLGAAGAGAFDDAVVVDPALAVDVHTIAVAIGHQAVVGPGDAPVVGDPAVAVGAEARAVAADDHAACVVDQFGAGVGGDAVAATGEGAVVLHLAAGGGVEVDAVELGVGAGHVAAADGAVVGDGGVVADAHGVLPHTADQAGGAVGDVDLHVGLQVLEHDRAVGLGDDGAGVVDGHAGAGEVAADADGLLGGVEGGAFAVDDLVGARGVAAGGVEAAVGGGLDQAAVVDDHAGAAGGVLQFHALAAGGDAAAAAHLEGGLAAEHLAGGGGAVHGDGGGAGQAGATGQGEGDAAGERGRRAEHGGNLLGVLLAGRSL